MPPQLFPVCALNQTKTCLRGAQPNKFAPSSVAVSRDPWFRKRITTECRWSLWLMFGRAHNFANAVGTVNGHRPSQVCLPRHGPPLVCVQRCLVDGTVPSSPHHELTCSYMQGHSDFVARTRIDVQNTHVPLVGQSPFILSAPHPHLVPRTYRT